MREMSCMSFFLALATMSCASQRQTGEALVVAGAATTVLGASAASSTYCSEFGCYQHPPASWGKDVAAAGAALAAAGYAVMATARRGDTQTRSVPPPAAASGEAWRLRRKDPRPEPPAELTEEPNP
jgi:hypothetical protein